MIFHFHSDWEYIWGWLKILKWKLCLRFGLTLKERFGLDILVARWGCCKLIEGSLMSWAFRAHAVWAEEAFLALEQAGVSRLGVRASEKDWVSEDLAELGMRLLAKLGDFMRIGILDLAHWTLHCCAEWQTAHHRVAGIRSCRMRYRSAAGLEQWVLGEGSQNFCLAQSVNLEKMCGKPLPNLGNGLGGRAQKSVKQCMHLSVAMNWAW